ncbi:tetratricopeptide repeat protein [Bifidobacterium actinocoloniiforme DSM 22766]|nr:tetratricopeptide repeat protein [Bifidobacterium actinocoloniiforme DSM 22766]
MKGSPTYMRQNGSFDSGRFIQGLDAIFDSDRSNDDAECYLLQALADAEQADDQAGQLTVLNEVIGYYRSRGRHEDGLPMIERSLDLARHMGLEGTEAWTTTLINAATGMRAASRYERAEKLYKQALASAERTLKPDDRRLAALHNNLSMLYSDTGRGDQGVQELQKALSIVTASSTDPDADLDVASTHTNLALALLDLPADDDQGEREQVLAQAMAHASKALDIYRVGHLEANPHFASALAGYGQACFASGQYGRAAGAYQQALGIIARDYGEASDSYRITQENLSQALQAAKQAGQEIQGPDKEAGADGEGSDPGTGADASTNKHSERPPMSGLKLARAYWEQCGKPMIEAKYPQYAGRIAAGLVGHGSECYGFDDAISRDHDFGPGFCLWLTAEDYAAIGEQLQADYEALPQEFMGYGPRERSVRARGEAKRVGVFEIGDFFESITGYRQAPDEDKPHEWLLLDEATLAAATNGEIFSDPLGALLSTRQGFQSMPDDVRFALISRRLGMISQAGQYNLQRSLERGDGAAAWLAVDEFAKAVASLVFLINNPLTVGYLPYYKWTFAALRQLSGRVATRLSPVAGELESILRLSSAACFGGAGFGEGGKGAAPAAERLTGQVETVCQQILQELRAEGLTNSSEGFLEWQRPYIEAHISSQDPVLHSI